MATIDKPSHDGLGDRMKRSYEDRWRMMLPRRTYTILRVDGKAFHTYTSGFDRPYSCDFMTVMDETATELCAGIMGVQLAYVQSDEISVLLTDFATPTTEAWFDGNLQKIVSVGAAMATMKFNIAARMYGMMPNAMFDARVFVIPDPVEVANYFIWRQKDAERNSLSMLAQSYASPKQLHGKGRDEQHEIIHAAGDNWAKHPDDFKRGRCVVKKDVPEGEIGSRWTVDHSTPEFVKCREYLTSLIPVPWAEDIAMRSRTETIEEMAAIPVSSPPAAGKRYGTNPEHPNTWD